MSRYFKLINKKSVQIDVFHGWDVKLKQWFIDVKMSGFIERKHKTVFFLRGKLQQFFKKIFRLILIQL